MANICVQWADLSNQSEQLKASKTVLLFTCSRLNDIRMSSVFSKGDMLSYRRRILEISNEIQCYSTHMDKMKTSLDAIIQKYRETEAALCGKSLPASHDGGGGGGIPGGFHLSWNQLDRLLPFLPFMPLGLFGPIIIPPGNGSYSYSGIRWTSVVTPYGMPAVAVSRVTVQAEWYTSVTIAGPYVTTCRGIYIRITWSTVVIPLRIGTAAVPLLGYR